jgi:LPXTG-site transpeptidase (sortase) family protein
VEISPAAILGQQVYPGQALSPPFWGNPLAAEEPSSTEASLIQDFRLLDSSMAVPVGTLSGPTRIFIPSIGVNSKVDSLKILDLGDSRAYETPKHVVGHIPQTANPGEAGSVWLFGHLESPIQGEGNVFSNLPQIPDLLRKGENVYAVVENGQDSYLYRITETKVVHQDDLAMYDTGESTIHLVTCVPRWVYDHRLIVTGQLVGVK